MAVFGGEIDTGHNRSAIRAEAHAFARMEPRLAYHGGNRREIPRVPAIDSRMISFSRPLQIVDSSFGRSAVSAGIICAGKISNLGVFSEVNINARIRRIMWCDGYARVLAGYVAMMSFSFQCFAGL
jgi:hypothetical protein